MPPAAGGQRIDALYWELELRAQGVEAGAAKTKAVLKEIDLAAERTKRNLNDIGGSSTDYQKKQQAIGDLNKAFAAGLITEAQYVEQSKALGVNLKTLTPAASAAAAAFVAEGAAATGAAVATEAVGVATKGLLRTLGPFLVAMIGIELGAKLVRTVWQALTGTAGELKRKVDELTDSLIKQKQAAFDATLEGQRAIQAGAVNAELAAQAKVAEIGPRTFANRTIFARAQAELAKATLAQQQAQAAVTETLERNAEREATALGQVLSAGIATNAMRGKANILVADYNRQINELLSTGRTDAATVDQINRLQGMVDALTAADKKAEKTAERAEGAAQRLREEQARARAGFAAAIAAKTPGTEDDLEAQITKLVAAARHAKLGTDEIQKAVADLRQATADSLKREGDALAEQLRTQLVATTVTAVDDLTEALHRFDEQIEAARRKGTPIDDSLVTQLREAKVAAIEVTKEVEALNLRLEFYDRQRAQSKNDIRFISELNFERSRLELQLKSVANEDDRRRILKEIEDIEKRIEAAIKGQTAPAAETESRTARIAGNIAAIANVAFGLASAFAGANSELAKMLGSIGQIAGGIQSALSATTFLGKLAGLGQAIGGGMALASALFGQSPEEKARADRIRENTEALRRLTDRVGDIGKINIPGATVGRVQAALADPAFAVGNFPFFVRDMEAVLARFGLSFAQLKEIAKDFGITLEANAEDFAALAQAIKAADLTKFADSFSGQMQEFAAEAKLFDLTSLIDQLAAFRRALDRIKDGGGILSEALANFDLSTAAGIEAAKKVLQDLFTQFQALEPEDIPSFLGGLTPDEFLQAIERWKDLLNQASIGTGGFADTFAGQMAKLQDQIQLFDIKDPIAQLKAFRLALDGIKGKGGILADLLDKFDLTNPEGIGAAIKALQDLFTQATAGALTPTQLGGLTGQELIDAILKATDLLKGAQPGGAAGTGGFNVETKITEVTGSRMAALLTTANVFAERTSQNTAGILARLLGEPLPVLPPIPTPPPASPASPPPGTSFFGGPPVNAPASDTALLALANAFAERTAISAEAILAKIGLGLVNPPPVLPPVYVPFGGAPVNNTSSNITLAAGAVQITISGPVTDPQTTGVVIAESFIREIDTRLGGRAAWARRAAGDIRVS